MNFVFLIIEARRSGERETETETEKEREREREEEEEEEEEEERKTKKERSVVCSFEFPLSRSRQAKHLQHVAVLGAHPRAWVSRTLRHGRPPGRLP